MRSADDWTPPTIEDIIERLEDGEVISVDDETLTALEAADDRIRTVPDNFCLLGLRAFIVQDNPPPHRCAVLQYFDPDLAICHICGRRPGLDR